MARFWVTSTPSRHRERVAYQWSVDVTVYIHPDGRRQGIARALYQALFGVLHLQGFCAAHAGIALPNPGSVGLHESLGFRQIALYPQVGYKAGAWHDVGWWQLSLAERGAEPMPPTPFPTLLADPEVFVPETLALRAWETITSTL